MYKKYFWQGILFMALVFGITVIGCDNSGSTGDGVTVVSNDSTLYDPEGVWDVMISGQNMIVTVTGNTWIFTSPKGDYDDTGTYTLKGNVATLYSNEWKANIGTVTMKSDTKMTIRLTSPSLIRGTFNGTKRV